MRYATKEKLILGALIFVAIFVGLLLFVYSPVALHTEAQCLERGYPKYAITWNLKRYCMNLEGTVTVKVDAIEGQP